MKPNYMGTSTNRRVKECRSKSATTISRSREISRQLAQVKRALAREFGTAISGQGHLLNSALNEAEAIAWQTEYPHLVFPTLAEEKASSVNKWAARQRRVLHASRQMSLSA